MERIIAMRIATSKFRLQLTTLAVALSFVSCTLPSSGSQVAQQPTIAVSGDQAYEHVRYLADNIGPRVASTDNSSRAADYIAEQFRSLGLEVDRQAFDFLSWEEKNVELEVVEPSLGRVKANPIVFSASGEVTTELLDAGDGRSEDFVGKDARGKIALIERGDIPFGTKVSNAAEAGAIGAIVYNNAEGELRGLFEKPSAIPAVGITREDGRRLLETLSKGAVYVRLLVVAEVTPKTSENVVGTKSGQGNRTIVLSAHYDSVEGSPGGNDNASGVGTVIELARASSAKSYQFELRFIAFGAEELGLIGSRRYVESLGKEDREKIMALLNFDMVGVGEDLAFGGDPDLVAYAISFARDLGVEASELDSKVLRASDQASFMDIGKPVLMTHWQDDPNYHSRNDKAEFVKPEKLEIAGNVASGILDRAARMDGAKERRSWIDARFGIPILAHIESIAALW